MSNLSRATFRVVHSLRRKAAGEHDVSTEDLIIAFAGEWGLRPRELDDLIDAAREEEQRIAAKQS